MMIMIKKLIEDDESNIIDKWMNYKFNILCK